MRKSFMVCLLAMFLMASMSIQALASGGGQLTESKTAIILASFGTTVPEAVSAITNIQAKVKKAFPGVPVKVTFTSNIIRSVWKERQADAKTWLGKGIPEEILYVRNIIATFGDLREEGYTDIIVQPTHMFFMEQSHDLTSYVNAMRSIRTMKQKWMPFHKIAMGRPALGTVGPQYDYHEDVEKAIKTLADDFAMAKKNKATLVYMGHGNEHWSTGIYSETAKAMREMYPAVKTIIGSVEGYPSIDDVLKCLSRTKGDKVILKPFMIVAGDHATNDMASEEDDSWKTLIEEQGLKVMPVLKGLGSNDAFAGIFVEHIRDAAKDAGIALK
ncbi:sirohydrochlorin cobaltochelatase [Desulfosarcina ovata]|uniref:Cobalt chelatase n=1 Tax=Desulfosarcina ovata subsp. ovata TaxID=2752305 RepID=A0A5K8AAN0_9BACT|nr:sirohydrochlorin cobaltochelatase [Desulfosarcina ovata]BBO89665.1 cobalt chelatase [Desulfosarcina ovata subsp. ovata]